MTKVLLDAPVGWGLSGARSAVRRAAIRGGLAPSRADDLVIAANEVITNALIHGGGKASLSVEAGPGWVICRIADRGGGFEGQTMGRRTPDLRHVPQGGMGLWMVRALCDDVRIERDADGALVILRMRAS